MNSALKKKTGNTKNNSSNRRLAASLIFYILVAAIPLILLSPSLKKDWGLIDDPDTMTYSIRAIDAILEDIDFKQLYSPVNRYGSRFHPGFYLYRGILAKIIGLNPFVNHLWQFLLLYLHIGFMHLIIFRLTRSYLSSFFGICLYLFYAQSDWSTAYYNWYSLMTFEPWLLLNFLLSMFTFHFSNQISEKKFISKILLLISVIILGYAFFTKEIAFIFTGIPFLVFFLSLSKRFNPFQWKKSHALFWFAGSLFFAVLFLAVYKILKSGGGGVEVPQNYDMSPGYILTQIPELFFILFRNYTFLIFIIPGAFLLRMIFLFHERRNPGKREIVQLVFLVFGLLWLGMLLPWKVKLERLFLIPVWCFGLFSGLELHGQWEFLLKGERRIQRTSLKFKKAFFATFSILALYFMFGRLVLSIQPYALILKLMTAGFGVFIFTVFISGLIRQGKINRLLAVTIAIVTSFSFLFFLFVGSISAYNFNYKYDGIEGVLVDAVKRVATYAKEDANIYVHLPEGHMYIAEMNFRLPLFEKRTDLEAFAFSAEPGMVYHEGDYLIHHPWLSPRRIFPFFKYEGELEELKRIKISHPKIQGATWQHFKKWLIAHFTFPRDPRVRLLEKKSHRNWWEIYLVMSKRMKILPPVSD